jgi:ATP-dependent Zn protease
MRPDWLKAPGLPWAIGYLVATALLVALATPLLVAQGPITISYSEFKALVARGKVSDLVLEKETITGTVPATGLDGLVAKETLEAFKRHGGPTSRFTTVRVDDPGLVANLEAAAVKFTGRAERTGFGSLLSWILPTLLFLGVWSPRQALFLAVPTAATREYSERTAEAVDAEIQTLLEQAHGRVRATLTARRATLEALAKRLIETEVVDRSTLAALIADTSIGDVGAARTPKEDPHGRGEG